MRKSSIGDREALDALRLFLRHVFCEEACPRCSPKREITGTMDIGPVTHKPRPPRPEKIFGHMDIGPVRNMASAAAKYIGRMDIGPVMWRRK